MLNGQNIASEGDVVITDIGEGINALACMTDQTDCCDNVAGRTRRGEWRLPNGTLVGTAGGGGDFYRNRGNQLVILNRRNDALEPLGRYCCEVDTTANPDGVICIDMGK